MGFRKKKKKERVMIWALCKLLPTDEIIWMSDQDRLNLLIDLSEDERNMLIELCSKIIVTSMRGASIKMDELHERYADQLRY